MMSSSCIEWRGRAAAGRSPRLAFLLFQTGNPVAFIDEYDFRLISLDLGCGHGRIGADDQQVTQMGFTRGGAIEGNLAAAALALDGISGKALAIIDVVQLDLFELPDVSRFQQVFVDTARPFVVQVALGDGGAMDLRAEHDTLHFFS